MDTCGRNSEAGTSAAIPFGPPPTLRRSRTIGWPLSSWTSVERIAIGTGQRFRRNDLALAERQTEIGAQRLPAGAEDRDFLDRHGVEGGLPHRRDVVRLAAIHAARRQTVERGDHLRDAGFGERDRALGGGVDLLLALPVDQPADPEIEREQRRAGEQYADDDRNNIFARKSAHN